MQVSSYPLKTLITEVPELQEVVGTESIGAPLQLKRLGQILDLSLDWRCWNFILGAEM